MSVDTTPDLAAPSPAPSDAVGGRGRALRVWGRATSSRAFAVSVLLVGLFAYFAATQPFFLTTANLTIMLASASILFLVAIGMTFVLLTGGFDLSMGAVLALTGVAIGALTTQMSLPLGVALVGAIGVAALVGLANGVLVGRVGLSFLVVTLGTSSLSHGVLNLWSEGQTRSVTSASLDTLAFGSLLAVPAPVWIMAAVFAVSYFTLRWTYLGRDIYAVGGNPAAARLSGIRVHRTVLIVYVIAGVLAGVAGIMQVARIGAASPLVGGMVVFEAAAAALLGGTSLRGGVGGVTGTAAGVLFLAVLQNGLAVSGVQSHWQQVVTGLILVIVVAVDQGRQDGWLRRRFRDRPRHRTVSSTA